MGPIRAQIVVVRIQTVLAVARLRTAASKVWTRRVVQPVVSQSVVHRQNEDAESSSEIQPQYRVRCSCGRLQVQYVASTQIRADTRFLALARAAGPWNG